MTDDLARVAALTAAIVAPLTSILTLLLGRGVEALRGFNSDKRDALAQDRTYLEAQRKDAEEARKIAFEATTEQFEARVVFLETEFNRAYSSFEEARKELSEVKGQHADCLLKQEELRGDLKALKVHVDRLWAHDKANKLGTAELKAEIDRRLAEQSSGGQATESTPNT
jgi:chromosome segregation ATPase